MADALDSKSSDRKIVKVQVLSPARLFRCRIEFYKNPQKSYSRTMKTFIRLVAVVFVSVCLMLKANAQAGAALSGTVKDSSGKPLQGAEIRIQGSDPSKIGKAHTDASGHYNYPALEAGTYSVVLAVHGATKASISNVRTKAGETQTLNFDFQGSAAARPFAKGKHYVWVPSQTGTHLGAWVEVEDDGKVMPSGMAERVNNAGNSLVHNLQLKGADSPNQH
jgi:hypothetical protein